MLGKQACRQWRMAGGSAPPATRPTQLDAMEFDEYEKVYRLWREGKVDLAEVARDYGNDVADMVQAQHAIVGLQDGGEEVEPLPSPQPLDTRERSGMVKEGGPRPPFGFFENMYGQWKQGMRTDKNVAAAFGAEWLVLFQMWKTWAGLRRGELHHWSCLRKGQATSRFPSVSYAKCTTDGDRICCVTPQWRKSMGRTGLTSSGRFRCKGWTMSEAW